MDIGLLERRFERMGARVKVREIEAPRNVWARRAQPGIDIGTDNKGEFFDIKLASDADVEYEVVDLRPEARHLLLLARRENAKEKFLCGHDERHWFVCAVPGRSVASVADAFESLQPPLVRWSVYVNLKRHKNRFRRRNDAFVRQGEWFFVPMPEIVVSESLVLKDEPLSRGGGSKPHTCQFAYRTGGEVVMVCSRYPSGVTEAVYWKLLSANPKAQKWNWQRLVRDPQLFVRGRVWHKDHKTVVLDGWHRVAMNTESDAPWVSHVVFLD